MKDNIFKKSTVGKMVGVRLFDDNYKRVSDIAKENKIPKGEVVRIIEEREQFPPDTAFGDWAWAFRNYEDAILKFKQLETS